jgi:hypothetical protein
MLLAGIIAKGLGIIAAIFLAGFVLGVVLCLVVTVKFRRARH